MADATGEGGAPLVEEETPKELSKSQRKRLNKKKAAEEKKRLEGTEKNEEASNNGGPREGRLLHTLFVYGCGCLFQCGFGLLDSPGLHAGQTGD